MDFISDRLRQYSALVMVALVCVLLWMMFPRTCRAAPVWSDNFDDGNYDGWMVANGTFTAAGHTLKPIGGAGYIIHPSSVETGTWSFDILPGTDTAVMFICNHPVPINESIALGIVVGGGGHPALALIELREGSGTSNPPIYYYERSPTAWQHVDITRDSEGRVHVYLNGTLALDEMHPGFTSQYLAVQFIASDSLTISNAEGGLDNIVVSNTIDIESPPVPFYRQPWFIPAVFAAVIAAPLIVALLIRRKSRSRPYA